MKLKELLRERGLWVKREERGPGIEVLETSPKLPGLIADWAATENPRNPDEVDVPPSILERLKSAPDMLTSMEAPDWSGLVTRYLRGRKLVEIGPGRNPITLKLPLWRKLGLEVYYIQPFSTLGSLLALSLRREPRFSLIKRVWITKGLHELGKEELDMLKGAGLVVSRCVFPHLAQEVDLSLILSIVRGFLADRGVLIFNFPPYILSGGDFMPMEEYLEKSGWEIVDELETPMCCALREPLFSGRIYVLRKTGEGEEIEGRLPVYPRDRLRKYAQVIE